MWRIKLSAVHTEISSIKIELVHRTHRFEKDGTKKQQLHAEPKGESKALAVEKHVLNINRQDNFGDKLNSAGIKGQLNVVKPL